MLEHVIDLKLRRHILARALAGLLDHSLDLGPRFAFDQGVDLRRDLGDGGLLLTVVDHKPSHQGHHHQGSQQRHPHEGQARSGRGWIETNRGKIVEGRRRRLHRCGICSGRRHRRSRVGKYGIGPTRIVLAD